MSSAFLHLRNKLRAAISRRGRERDMDDEMRFHVEMEAAELRRAGVPAGEAMRRAHALFGGIERQKEEARDVVGLRLVDDLVQDLRYGLRQLAASPGFTAATLLTLALGIGATTTMYTIGATLTKHSGPFLDGDRLVHVAQGQTGDCLACWRLATGNYLTIRERSRSLKDVTLIADWSPILRGAERTEVIRGAGVTPAFFQLLGVPAMLGRTIVPGDSAADRRNIVVVSEAFWRTRLGADSAAIGKTIVLDARPRTVVGVVEDRFDFPDGAMLWSPFVLGPAAAEDRSWTDDNAIARLRPGATLDQARAELATIGASVASSYPETMRNTSFGAMPFADWRSAPGSSEALPLFLSVAIVLAIACANLAGLLLARLTSRRKELAVRAAMGAGGRRIARQLLTETVLLATGSGALGAGVAALAVHAVRVEVPAAVAESLSNWMTMAVDFRALIVALATGLVTGVAIGLWPATRFSRPSLADELKGGTRSATPASGISRLRRGLVIAEVAFAIVVLTAAGLLARSVRNMYRVEPGFRIDHLLTFRVSAPPRAPGVAAVNDSLRWDRLADRLRTLPGVEHAATVYGLPYSGAASTELFAVQGRTPVPLIGRRSVRMAPAGVDYFATLGIPIRRGRAFSAADGPHAAHVAVVDQTIADRDFAGEDPIGRRVVIDSGAWTIVGVAGATRYDARGHTVSQVAGEIYRPMAQWPRRFAQFAIRTRGDPAALAGAVQEVVRRYDPDLAVSGLATMESLMSDDVAPDRVVAALMAAFAAVAVLISVIGLYGVTSYGVAQRTREFGIRRALGAESRALLAQVLGQGASMAALGALIGLAGAVVVSRLMRALLFEISPTDPATLAVVAAAMCLLGLGSAYLPARRATRVDPMISLREE